MSGCINCTAAIFAAKAEDEKTRDAAKSVVLTTGKTQALYRDEHGKLQYISADAATGYPVTEFISPFHINAAAK